MTRFIQFILLFAISFLVSAQCALCPPDDGGGGGDGGGDGGPIEDPIDGDGGGGGGGIDGGFGNTVTLTGITNVLTNAEYFYNLDITGNVFSHTNTTYTVNGGTVLYSGNDGVRVKWTVIGNRYIDVNTQVNLTYYSYRLQVNATGILYPGSVSAGTPTSFCGSTNPGNISGSDARGGNNSFSYKWLRFTGNSSTTSFVNSNGQLANVSNWTDAPGTNTGASYNPPTISSKTTYVRRVSSAGQVKYSNAVTYHRSTPTSVGNIMGAPSRCGTGSSNFSISDPTGNVLHWRKKYRNEGGAWQNTWTYITQSDLNSVSTSLSEWSGGPREWQIQVTVKSGVCAETTRTHYFTVYPKPVAASVSINTPSTVCPGTTVRFTSSTDDDKWFLHPTQGNAFHTGRSIEEVINSNTTYYVAGGSTNCGVTSTRTPITVNVYNGINVGAIDPPAETVNPGEIPAIITGSAASAGGGFTYQWKRKPAGASFFSNIPGATEQNLTLTEGLEVNTAFERHVIPTTCGSQQSSNTVFVNVNRLPGTIAGDQIICDGEWPTDFTSLEPATGGTGSDSYIWETRYEGGEWEQIEGAFEETYNPTQGLLLASHVPLQIGTTEFRRGTYGSSGLVYSNTVSIVVHDFPEILPDLLLNYSFEGLSSAIASPGVTYFWQTFEDGEEVNKPSGSHYITEVGTYFLRARTDSNCWGQSGAVTFNAAEPTSVTAESLSHKAILIDWEGTDSDEAYIVYRSASADTGFESIATVASAKTQYLDDNLEIGTTYFYRVQSTVGEQRSAARQVVSATTANELTAINYITHTPAYNGNITGMRWKGATDEDEQISTYSFDGLNRLSSAYYAQQGVANYDKNVGLYSVPDVKYDLNGNITHLSRQGIDPSNNADIIDQLTYDYGAGIARSNQLLAVSDAKVEAGFKDGSNTGSDYEYDANGNMVKDRNKEIDSIYYNHLNLPIIVDFATQGDSIRYLYDAAGIKLQQKVFEGGEVVKTTDYIGEFIYETDSTGERKLQLIQHEEGRIVADVPSAVQSENIVLFTTDFSSQPAQLTALSELSEVSFGQLKIKDKIVSGFSLGGPPSQTVTRGYAEFTLNTTAGKSYQLKYTLPSMILSANGNQERLHVRINGQIAQTHGADIGQKVTAFTANGAQTIVRFENDFAIDPLNPSTTIEEVNFAINDLSLEEEQDPIEQPIEFDYQYHLKDHLGNVRVTFSTTPENYIMEATMEHDYESEIFNNYVADVRNLPAESHSGTHVSRNSNLVNNGLDLNTFLCLNKGDTIKASAYAYYNDQSTSYDLVSTTIASTLFNSAFNPNKVAEGVPVTGTNFDAAFASGTPMAGRSQTATAPPAYINYIFFDSDMNYVTASFAQVTTASDGSSVQVVASDFIADRDGYIMIYLSNETGGGELVVSWDDFTVYHGKTNVVSTQDYYPGGSTFKSFTRTASAAQYFLYQSKELQLETKVYDFDARMYDAFIWRTLMMDPHSENYYDWSPYSWAGDNPILNIDPNGMDWFRYRNDNGNESVIWRDSNDKTLDIDGNTYTNIGAAYSYRSGNVTLSFNQNHLSTIEEHVLDPEDWVSDRPNGEKIQECFDASCKMVNTSGATPDLNYPKNRIVLGSERLVDGGYSVFPLTDGEKGQKYIDSQVDQGKSVLLGLDWKYGTVNSDGITDHWVALSSRITNVSTGTVSYRFFDPGTQHSFKGTNPDNILTLQSGMFRGTYYGKMYDLSAVRRNK